MASIVKRTTSAGEVRYDVRFRTPDGKVRTKTFTRRKDADRFVTGTEADKLEGRFVDPRSGRMTVADWWDEWWPTVPDLRPSSRVRDETYFRLHVVPTFGTTPLNRVTHQDVAEWVGTLTKKGLAPATVQKAHQVLGKTLRAAARSGRIAANPAEHVPLPTVEREEMRFLTPAEVAALADVIDPHYRALVVTASYGGLRLGELLGLRWGRVDLLHRHLDVAEVQTEVRGHVAYGPPKTRAGRRRVPLPRVAVDALTEHQKLVSSARDALVFPTADGTATRAPNLRQRVWNPATVAAGLSPLPKDHEDYDPTDIRARLRLHDLRHTAVSLWIAAGASPKAVATRAGHTSVSVVLDRYGHLLPGSEDAVNDALDALAAGATDTAEVVAFPTSR